MRVKIKHDGLICTTEKAICVRNWGTGKDCWFPKSKIKFLSEFKLIVPKWLAEKHNFNFSEIRHIPKKIKAKYKQKADDELRISNKSL